MLLVPRRSGLDLFDDFFRDDFLSARKESSLMKTNIKDKKDKYVIEMDLPGCEKENIDMKLENGYLIVSAETSSENEDEEEGEYIHQEKYYGSASRSFYVGDEVTEDEIDAEFKNGVLKVSIPKKDEENRSQEPKKISIK